MTEDESGPSLVELITTAEIFKSFSNGEKNWLVFLCKSDEVFKKKCENAFASPSEDQKDSIRDEINKRFSENLESFFSAFSFEQSDREFMRGQIESNPKHRDLIMDACCFYSEENKDSSLTAVQYIKDVALYTWRELVPEAFKDELTGIIDRATDGDPEAYFEANEKESGNFTEIIRTIGLETTIVYINDLIDNPDDRFKSKIQGLRNLRTYVESLKYEENEE